MCTNEILVKNNNGILWKKFLLNKENYLIGRLGEIGLKLIEVPKRTKKKSSTTYFNVYEPDLTYFTQ